jgi:hypothetical protein
VVQTAPKANEAEADGVKLLKATGKLALETGKASGKAAEVHEGAVAKNLEKATAADNAAKASHQRTLVDAAARESDFESANARQLTAQSDAVEIAHSAQSNADYYAFQRSVHNPNLEIDVSSFRRELDLGQEAAIDSADRSASTRRAVDEASALKLQSAPWDRAVKTAGNLAGFGGDVWTVYEGCKEFNQAPTREAQHAAVAGTVGNIAGGAVGVELGIAVGMLCPPPTEPVCIVAGVVTFSTLGSQGFEAVGRHAVEAPVGELKNQWLQK